MKANPEVCVTLSEELLGHLRGLAAELDVPLEWLAAGVVCDTIEGLAEGGIDAGAVVHTGHRPT
jgi:hypothetical protein